MRFSTLHTGTKSGFSDFLYVSSNHLGNVITTVSDRKIVHSTNGTTVDYFTPDIVSANDFYVFGFGGGTHWLVFLLLLHYLLFLDSKI